MDDKVTAQKELIRAATRPVLIILMVISTVTFKLAGINDPMVEAWMWATIGMVSEWVLERPILKAAGKA